MSPFYSLVLLIVVCQPSLAIGWKDILMNVVIGNFQARMNLPAGLKAMITNEISKADIRLLRKDNEKIMESKPLMSKTRMNEEEARSIFEDKWDEYYEWSYDLDSEYQPIRQAAELFSSTHYNASLGSLLILHDRCGSAKDRSVAKILEALKFRNFDVHYNIFLLDFPMLLCQVMPLRGLFNLGFDPQIRVLGTVIAKMLHEGIEEGVLKSNTTHILGLGVSTHLAGLIARQLNSLTGEKVMSILGLDPPVRLVKRLVSKYHAENIHIYHTYTLLPKVGPRLGMGTADFVFGGAKKNPLCNPLKTECFAEMGVRMFVATLLYPKRFPARWCPSFQQFSHMFCNLNEPAYVSFPPVPVKPKGTYHLLIDPTFPYGKGPEGIFATEEELSGHSSETEPTVDVESLSDQEYAHYLEKEVVLMRKELMACMPEHVSIAMKNIIMKCVLETQKHVKPLVDKGFIKRMSCEPQPKSPTGKTCKYAMRTNNVFQLPY